MVHSSVPDGHSQAPLARQSAPAGQQFWPQIILGGSHVDGADAGDGVGVLVGAAGCGGWMGPVAGAEFSGVAAQVPS